MLSFNILYPDLIKDLLFCGYYWKRGLGVKGGPKPGWLWGWHYLWVGKLEGKVRFSVESTQHWKSQKHQMGMQKEGAMVNPHPGRTLVSWSFSGREHCELFIFIGEFLSKSILNLALSLLSKGILRKKRIKLPKFHMYIFWFLMEGHIAAAVETLDFALIILDIIPTLPNDFPCWPDIYEWLRLTNCFHFSLVSSFLLLVKKRNKMLKTP
jgi:hypothetical protein